MKAGGSSVLLLLLDGSKDIKNEWRHVPFIYILMVMMMMMMTRTWSQWPRDAAHGLTKQPQRVTMLVLVKINCFLLLC